MDHRSQSRVALALLLPLALAACVGTGEKAKPTVPPDLAVRYACNDGHRFVARFVYAEPRRVMIDRHGLPPLELPQAQSAAGFRYADARHELAGEGEVARWTADGHAPVRCTTQHAPAPYVPGSALSRPAN